MKINKKTDEDIKCESQVLGYEKEEANDFTINTLKENERLDVMNNEVKLYKCKAYDNSKLIKLIKK